MPTTISIDLNDVELAALQSELLSGETISDVIHRLISPIVDRQISTQFDTLLSQYKALPLDSKIAVLSSLQTLATAISTSTPTIVPTPVLIGIH
jgi:hypothetical protein